MASLIQTNRGGQTDVQNGLGSEVREAARVSVLNVISYDILAPERLLPFENKTEYQELVAKIRADKRPVDREFCFESNGWACAARTAPTN